LTSAARSVSIESLPSRASAPKACIVWGSMTVSSKSVWIVTLPALTWRRGDDMNSAEKPNASSSGSDARRPIEESVAFSAVASMRFASAVSAARVSGVRNASPIAPCAASFCWSCFIPGSTT
jgi:hypothetical protein